MLSLTIQFPKADGWQSPVTSGIKIPQIRLRLSVSFKMSGRDTTDDDRHLLEMIRSSATLSTKSPILVFNIRQNDVPINRNWSSAIVLPRFRSRFNNFVPVTAQWSRIHVTDTIVSNTDRYDSWRGFFKEPKIFPKMRLYGCYLHKLQVCDTGRPQIFRREIYNAPPIGTPKTLNNIWNLL